MWYWNAFKSLKLNELPMDIVWELIREVIVHKEVMLTCAVSPAQRSPFGLLHEARRTEVREWFGQAGEREEHWGHTKGVYEEVILYLINIPTL